MGGDPGPAHGATGAEHGGTNVIAIQAFNSTITSTDFGFNAQLFAFTTSAGFTAPVELSFTGLPAGVSQTPAALGDATGYLLPGSNILMQLYKGDIIGVELPAGVRAAYLGNDPRALTAYLHHSDREPSYEDAIDRMTMPVLLIVGERDEVVLTLNQTAAAQLWCEKALHIVPGATHLFEEPGTLAEVAQVATRWFQQHLHADMQHQPEQKA